MSRKLIYCVDPNYIDFVVDRMNCDFVESANLVKNHYDNLVINRLTDVDKIELFDELCKSGKRDIVVTDHWLFDNGRGFGVDDMYFIHIVNDEIVLVKIQETCNRHLKDIFNIPKMFRAGAFDLDFTKTQSHVDFIRKLSTINIDTNEECDKIESCLKLIMDDLSNGEYVFNKNDKIFECDFIDSLDVVELAMMIEEQYDFNLEDDFFENRPYITFGDLINHINLQLK